jgi:hypothetical protein
VPGEPPLSGARLPLSPKAEAPLALSPEAAPRLPLSPAAPLASGESNAEALPRPVVFDAGWAL